MQSAAGPLQRRGGAERRGGFRAPRTAWPLPVKPAYVLLLHRPRGAGRTVFENSVKDVDGLYDSDPKTHSQANFIPKISTAELRERSLETLPFDTILLDLLESARLVTRLQIINGNRPELLEPALDGEHVGTIVYAE